MGKTSSSLFFLIYFLIYISRPLKATSKYEIYLTFPPLTIVLAGFLAIALVFSDGFSGLFFFLNILLKAKGIANPEELVPPTSEFE